jgi:hypothetical protein
MRFAILTAFLLACSSCWTVYREVAVDSQPAALSARKITLPQYKIAISMSPTRKGDEADYRVDLGFYEITKRSHLDLSGITLSLSAYEKNQPPYTLQKTELATLVKTEEGTIAWRKTLHQSLKDSSGIDLAVDGGYRAKVTRHDSFRF